MRFDEFYNPRVMAWNEYLHVWQTYAICPFANAVVLATEEPVPATSVTFGTDTVNLNLSSKPQGEDLNLTVTPKNATTDVEFKSSDTKVFTVAKQSNKKCHVTPVAEGSAKLTLKTDNGLSDEATVTVTNG